MNATDKLSTHFTYGELTTTSQRDKKTGVLLDNTPNETQLANLRRLAAFMEYVRDLVGGPVRINSAFRSPAVNKAISGAWNSQHLDGEAADFVPKGSLKEAFEKIQKSDLPYDQLIYEFGTWIHISVARAGKKPRRQVYMIGSWTVEYSETDKKTKARYKLYDSAAIK